MRAGVLGVVLLALLAGCSSASPSVVVTTASPTATAARPTETHSIIPGPLAPGRYLQKTLTPPVSFVLGEGWQAYFNDADGAYLGSSAGIEFGVNRPPKVVDPATDKWQDAPADLAAWLAGSPAFASATATKVEIDGREAMLIDATASHRETDLFAYTSGNFHTVIKARYHFYVVPLDGPDLVFHFMGPAATFDAAVPALDAIVSSITIGG